MQIKFVVIVELLVIAGTFMGLALDYDGASAGSIARQVCLAAIAIVCVIASMVN